MVPGTSRILSTSSIRRSFSSSSPFNIIEGRDREDSAHIISKLGGVDVSDDGGGRLDATSSCAVHLASVDHAAALEVGCAIPSRGNTTFA